MKKRGELIIEASILITILVGLFFAIISYALLVRTEIIVQNNLNQSMKQLSQYTNIVSELIVSTSKDSDKLKKAEEIIGESSKFLSAIQNPNASDSSGEIVSIVDATSLINELKKSSKKLNAKALLSLVKSFAVRESIKVIGNGVAEVFFRQGIANNNVNLEKIGVIGDVNFVKAEYDDKNFILTVTIEYETKGMFYDMFKINKNKVVQKSSVRLWVGDGK